MRTFLQTIGGVVAGAVGMQAILYFIPWPRLTLSAAELVLLLVALPPLFLLMIAIHEGGHLIAGAFARFRPCLLIVGPFKLERTMTGWQPGINQSFPLYGGLAAAIPQGVDRLRQRMATLVAGGPSASILTGLVALVALATIGITRDARLSGGATIVFLLTFAFGVVSLAIGIGALVPGRGDGFASDGARLLRFLTNAPEVDGEVALLSIVGASMAGQRPRDWDPTVVALALRLAPDTSHGAAARMLAHSHALDRQDIPRAREYLHAALAHHDALPSMSLPALLLQAAYFEAVHEQNPVSARRYLTSAGPGVLVSPHEQPLAEAAVLLAERNDREAAASLARAAREISHASDKGGALMAADLIAQMHGTLQDPTARF
jgi:hypothetical protein